MARPLRSGINKVVCTYDPWRYKGTRFALWSMEYKNVVGARDEGTIAKRTFQGIALPDVLKGRPLEFARDITKFREWRGRNLLDWPMHWPPLSAIASKEGRYYILLVKGWQSRETYHLRTKDFTEMQVCLENMTGIVITREALLVTGNKMFIDLQADGLLSEHIKARLSNIIADVEDLGNEVLNTGVGGEVLLKLLEANAALHSIYPLFEVVLNGAEKTQPGN